MIGFKGKIYAKKIHFWKKQKKNLRKLLVRRIVV